MPHTLNTGNLNSRWRALLIRDDAGAERLNALLEKGWYLELIELDGLPFLIFPIAPEDFGAQSPDNPGSTDPQGRPLVLVLTRQGKPRRQRAVVLRPDEQGYFDLGWLNRELGAESKGVYGTAFFRMENGNRLALVDWGETS